VCLFISKLAPALIDMTACFMKKIERSAGFKNPFKEVLITITDEDRKNVVKGITDEEDEHFVKRSTTIGSFEIHPLEWGDRIVGLEFQKEKDTAQQDTGTGAGKKDEAANQGDLQTVTLTDDELTWKHKDLEDALKKGGRQGKKLKSVTVQRMKITRCFYSDPTSPNKKIINSKMGPKILQILPFCLGQNRRIIKKSCYKGGDLLKEVAKK